ncbi:predicted protein [Lichtheimia corymbifera JMRC:FSU:9682]|uniref:PiggyBac transposable element-derived protein domain-containing protein n=1 Tax=Lichtheimia corymbifera JMRC:FSU:9682 TaxID=1263082 RepID=A0A068S033_9FUNG|nr:predicted protein [Lichtheimia corymbifera JMRC:FSU:9682]
MPKNLARLTIGVRVSFKPRAFTSFEEANKFNTTKASDERLFGIITAIEVEGRSSIAVIDVDGFAGVHARIKLDSLKYEKRQPAVLQQRSSLKLKQMMLRGLWITTVIAAVMMKMTAVMMKMPMLTRNQWIDEEVVVDDRLVKLSYTRDPQLTLPQAAYSTPMAFFKHFLPMEYIGQHVVLAINAKAAYLSIDYWQMLTVEEYMLWIGLWTCMVLIPLSDRSEYWSKTPTFLLTSPLNFSRWMSRRRFETILQAHTLEHPTVIQSSADPLVDIRAFVNAYNDNLAAALIAGKTMTIDESMNQWLGKVSRMPNVKKIIGKPHPVGQEFKNIADATTNIMIRLDISEKNQDGKEFSDKPRVTGCILRLTKPWFASGRTIVADSWFGSPAVAAELRKKGLFSIVSMKKRKYWPRNVLRTSLRTYLEFMDHITCSTTLPGSTVSHVVKENNRSRRVSFQRAVVFDDYNEAKGAIDINNNIRDNMISYHDVIRTNTWQHRSFAFFLAVAEANAFLAWRTFGPENLRGITHFKFRERLASELVHAYEYNGTENTSSASAGYHSLVVIGKKVGSNGKKYSMQKQCQHCKRRTTKMCVCNQLGVCTACIPTHFREV